MTPDSSLAFTSGRRSRRKPKPKLSLIAFMLRHEWFALPTQAVYRVVPLGSTYGTNPRTGVSLTRYQDRDIPVLDIEQQVFTMPAQTTLLPSSSTSTEPIQRYLLLIEPSPGDPIGILLNAPPHLHRVDETAFAPLPSVYQTGGSLRFVSALVSPAKDRPSMFLLNLSQLLQPLSSTALQGRSP
jgi:chemotaxis signal transduction protein